MTAPSGMVPVRTFDNMVDAHIALGRLQADGIEAHLMDENLVQADWLYSIAVGGIKLLVAAPDLARAQAMLAVDHSAELEAPASDGETGDRR